MSMKTILVAFTYLGKSIEEVNNLKVKKYAFRTEESVKVGDFLNSKSYDKYMLVTDVIDQDYKYYNTVTGEFNKEITSTNCYPIKTLVLREDDQSVVYACKIK